MRLLPKYENGDVIVVYRDQRHPVSNFYGEEAVVRLKTGERYLKTIEKGKSPTLVNLVSFNAKAINGVKPEWIGEIFVTLPRGQIQRMQGRVPFGWGMAAAVQSPGWVVRVTVMAVMGWVVMVLVYCPCAL